MRIAVLVKQVPAIDELRLGPDGRLERTDVTQEMNPYCRRALAGGIALARDSGGRCVVYTLGPPAAAEVLREAIACGADDAVLVTGAAFAGSDTLATARALAAAIRRDGAFDLVLTGKSSVDSDTGQVGPELAELLDLPFLPAARQMELDGDALVVTAERDDGLAVVRLRLPALVSAAERLCAPAKADASARLTVAPGRIRQLGSAALGAGPWGQAGSPTRVIGVQELRAARALRLLRGDRAGVSAAVRTLRRLGALDPGARQGEGSPGSPAARQPSGPVVAVLVEPGRPRLARELLGSGSALGAQLGGHCVALVPSRSASHEGELTMVQMGRWGADAVVAVAGSVVPEELIEAIGDWTARVGPWALLAPSTPWGREMAGRLAARLGYGLTGDAIELAVDGRRLVAWKPAAAGQLVAAITTDSPVQLVTVRPGTLPLPAERPATVAPPTTTLTACVRRRVLMCELHPQDDPDTLTGAAVVIGVGMGVPPDAYAGLAPLQRALGDAPLAATRKVTDRGWLPRSRQIGVTGRHIAPRLYVAIGLSGKLNHMIGVRSANTILAINSAAGAPVFAAADVGIVGDWRVVVPALVSALSTEHTGVKRGARPRAVAGG